MRNFATSTNYVHTIERMHKYPSNLLTVNLLRMA